MSRDATLVELMAGEKQTFRLAIGQLIKLQEETNVGPYVLLEQLRYRERATRPWNAGTEDEHKWVRIGADGELEPPYLPPTCSIASIRAIIRLGLEGGGMETRDANALIQSSLGNAHRDEDRALAFAILAVALYGASDEPPGEAEAANQISN